MEETKGTKGTKAAQTVAANKAKAAAKAKAAKAAKAKARVASLEKKAGTACLCCGTSYAGRINDSFYGSRSTLFVANGGKCAFCKVCMKTLYNNFLEQYEGDREFAFRHVCRMIGWYFEPDAYRQVSLLPDPLGEYSKRQNVGRLKGRTFLDNIPEERAAASAPVAAREGCGGESGGESGGGEKVYSEFFRGSFTAEETAYLEGYYDKMLADYKVATENHRDYARKIAKASLFMDKALAALMAGEDGAEVRYNKAREAFDSLSKSAKFSESSRSMNDVGLGCFGKIAERVEAGGYVYRHEPLEKDQIDELLDALKTIEKSF